MKRPNITFQDLIEIMSSADYGVHFSPVAGSWTLAPRAYVDVVIALYEMTTPLGENPIPVREAKAIVKANLEKDKQFYRAYADKVLALCSQKTRKILYHPLTIS